MKNKLGAFDRTEGKDEWLTPPEIIRALGPFDLDPCAPVVRPWAMAAEHYDKTMNGLTLPWFGRVWCNPPYGDQTGTWLNLLARHGKGIALVFARTETRNFFDFVWSKAHAVLFLKGRLRFYHVDGTQAAAAGAPSVLVAYSADEARRLEASGLHGMYVPLNQAREINAPRAELFHREERL